MLIVCLVSSACAHAHAQLRMCINACLLSVDRFHRFTDLDFLQSPPSAICVFLCLDCVRCVCAIDCAWNDRTKYCNKKNCTTHGRSVVGLWHSVCNWMNEAKHINIAMRRQCYYYISSTGNWACDGQKAFDDRHFYQPTQCRGESYFFSIALYIVPRWSLGFRRILSLSPLPCAANTALHDQLAQSD